MKFFKRWKSDKGFRNMVIVGIFLFIVMTSSSDNQAIVPAQDTCSLSNTALLTTDITNCKSNGCAVVAPDIPIVGILECVDNVAWGAGLNCVNNPGQKEFLANSASQATALCGEGKKAVESGSFCFQTLYSCVDVPKEELCKTWQKPFANILDSIWKNNGLDCNSKSYMVIGAAALIVVAVI